MSGAKIQDSVQGNSGFIRCKMNDDAILYNESNPAQTRDAIICLKEYTPRMKWKDGKCRIMDIGCGDGSVTNIIKEIIPQNYKEFVGCDLNEKMVNFANENYKNEKLYFRILDIEGSLPEELEESFNQVFSFHTLHWIKNQEKAFTNIYDLLLKGGDCLLAFLGYMPLYTAFWAVGSTVKWKKWIPNCEGFMSPYHHLQEPEIHLTNMLKGIGFKSTEVKCKQMKFTFTVESLKNTIRSINPFPMPKEVFNIFLDEFIIVMRDMRLMDDVNEHTAISDLTTVTIPYNLMVIYGAKALD